MALKPDAVVVSRPGDVHGDAVCDALVKRGMDVFRTSLDEFSHFPFDWAPGQALRFGDEAGEWEVLSGTKAYFRRPGWPKPQVADDRERSTAGEEIYAAFFGILAALNLAWLDSPARIYEAERKIHQLERAHQSDVMIPATLITSRPKSAGLFARTPTVVKALAGGTVETEHGPCALLTTPFTQDPELIDAVGKCPVILQEQVDGLSDARVVTVGNDAFCFVRRRDEGEAVDWRESDPEGRGFSKAHEPGLMDGAKRIAQALGLNFTSQDWLVTEEGAVFLEANPAGQWLFLNGGDDVTEALAELIFHGWTEI